MSTHLSPTPRNQSREDDDSLRCPGWIICRRPSQPQRRPRQLCCQYLWYHYRDPTGPGEWRGKFSGDGSAKGSTPDLARGRDFGLAGQSCRQSPHEASGLLDGVEYRGAMGKRARPNPRDGERESQFVETSQTPLLPFGTSKSLRGESEQQLCIHAFQYLDAMMQKGALVAIKPSLVFILFVHALFASTVD
jgi:hypothetical protein